MNRDETIVELITMLCSAFRVEADVVRIQAYAMGLDGVATDEIKQAVKTALMSDCKFMPTPGELRKLTKTKGVDYEAQAMVAWEDFERELTRHDSMPKRLENSITSAVVRQLGGWYATRQRPKSEDKWLRKEFMDAYETIAQQPPEQLAAITERTSEIGKAIEKRLSDKFTEATGINFSEQRRIGRYEQ